MPIRIYPAQMAEIYVNRMGMKSAYFAVEFSLRNMKDKASSTYRYWAEVMDELEKRDARKVIPLRLPVLNIEKGVT